MGSIFAFSLPYVPDDMSITQLDPPTNGWPSGDLFNENTQFSVYLLEVSANDTAPTHHELYVDLSTVYGLPPVSFEARTPSGTHIPVCGAVFHMGAEIIPTRRTYLRVDYWFTRDGHGGMDACKFLTCQVNLHPSRCPTCGTARNDTRYLQLWPTGQTRR